MSQRSVEQLIGMLVTDEAFRRRFEEDPIEAVREIHDSGLDLTALEQLVLSSIDPRLATRFANAIDPRIQKAAVPKSESRVRPAGARLGRSRK